MAKAKTEAATDEPVTGAAADATVIDESNLGARFDALAQRFDALAQRFEQLDSAAGTAIEAMNAEIKNVSTKLEEVTKALEAKQRSKGGVGYDTSEVQKVLDDKMKDWEERRAAEDREAKDRIRAAEELAQKALDQTDPMKSTIGPRGVP